MVQISWIIISNKKKQKIRSLKMQRIIDYDWIFGVLSLVVGFIYLYLGVHVGWTDLGIFSTVFGFVGGITNLMIRAYLVDSAKL
jgi:hypothetical protein